jgi:hypothetical protein
MTEPRKGILATAAAAVVAFGGFVTHEAGMWGDDIARNTHDVPPVIVHDPLPPPRLPEVPQVPRVPDVYIPPGTVDALSDPLVKATVKEAITLVRKWRKGDADERAVARATCKVLNAALAEEPDHARFKELITEEVEAETGEFATAIQHRYADQVANLLTVAHYNARAGLWYAQYCLKL